MDLERLYQDYFSIVYKYILSMSKDPLAAEEITQETFFKALKKIDEFRGDCSVRVWLCQIAKNTYYNYVKKQSRFVELKEDEELFEGAEYDFLAGYDSKAAHRILHNMKEPYKEVFPCAYSENYLFRTSESCLANPIAGRDSTRESSSAKRWVLGFR